MIIVIVLAALAIWGIAATAIEVRRDGYRAVPTDWARVAEHDLPADPRAPRGDRGRTAPYGGVSPAATLNP